MRYRKYGKKKSLASKVNAIAKTMSKFKPHNSFFDSYSSGVPVSTTGACIPLFYDYTGQNYMLEGNGIDDRNGDRVRYSKLWMNYLVHLGVTAGGSSDVTNQVRILIVRDKQSSGAIPAISTILNSVAGGSYSTISPINVANVDRFTVIYDKVVCVDDDDPEKRFRINKKLSGTAGFLNTNNAASCLGSNQLYMVLVSDSLLIAHPYVNYYSRITYTDV